MQIQQLMHVTEPVLRPAPGTLRLTGVALSGGGAKGSWQVGALKYLIHRQGIRPDIVTCTSVGAVNGLKLAEGEGPTPQGSTELRGLDGLEQIWLSLNAPSDMYAPSDALAKLGADAYNAPGLILQQVAEKAEAAVANVGGQGLLYMLFLGLPGVAFTDTTPVTSLINSILSLAEQSDSFYTLEPIAARLDNGDLNPQLLAHSGIDLAMATVSLTSGALRYVRFAGLDHNRRPIGYLVERDQMSEPLATVNSIGAGIDMKTAMLASAAAPMFFAPQQLLGLSTNELYTDGGVRELVPVQAAIDLGAHRVFALDCNAPFGASGTAWPHSAPSTPAGIFAIGGTVLAELLDEIDRGDTVPPPADGARFWHARPLFEIEGDMEIDPGAIRANIDYGMMCAFDAIDGSVRSAGRRALLQLLGSRIAVARRNALDAERCLQWVVRAWDKVLSGTSDAQSLVQALDYHRYPNDSDLGGRVANLTIDMDAGAGWAMPGDHYIDALLTHDQRPPQMHMTDAVARLQALKAQLKPLYEARQIVAGSLAVPPDPNDGSAPDQPWLRWDQPNSQAFYGDLWPDGFSGPSFDPTTMLEVVARQVEDSGTGGWALHGSGFLGDGAGISCQMLVAQGQTFAHLTGEWVPTEGVTWAPAAGARWKTNWNADTANVPDLGSPVSSVTMCGISAADTSAVRVIARMAGTDSAGDTLTELTYDPRNGWAVVGPVMVDGTALAGVIGNPVVIEASFAQEQSVELIVPLTDRVAHFHRTAAWGDWTPRGNGTVYTAPTPVSSGSATTTSAMVGIAVTCIQANYGLPSNLEAVVAVAPQIGQPADALLALYFDAYAGTWNTIGGISVSGVDLSSISADPVMFQSKIGRQGDFELLVPAGSKVLHLFRDNDNGMVWKPRGAGEMYDAAAAAGGGGILHPVELRPTPVAVAAWQSACGTPGTPDCHAIMRTLPPIVTQSSGNTFMTLRFDGAAQQWVGVDEVTLNGQPFTA